MIKAGTLALGLCFAAAAPAHAQMQWTDKVFVNVNVGAQVGSHDLDSTQTFTLYDEDATVSTSQKVKSGAFFDISAGYKVWRNLAVGLGYTTTGSDSDVTITGQIPDPRFYDQPRTVTSSASGLKHHENVINLDGTWMVPVTDKIDVGVSFGPSIFRVRQDLVTSLPISEPGPTVGAPTIEAHHTTTVGINLGVDLNYMVTSRYGVGGMMRYTWGSTKVPGASDSLTVGGFQIGIGGRARF